MKILVIEDNLKHLDDAKRFFAEQAGVQPIFTSTFHGAARFLEKGKVDGVISDIYFPLTNDITWGQPEAIGVSVMILCRERKIPCVLNTAGYHHGTRYQWVCDLQRALGLPEIVDASSNYNQEADTKNWQQAFDALRELISRA